MAEPARVQATLPVLRVAVRAPSPIERESLEQIVRELGHVTSETADTDLDVVLALPGTELATGVPVVIIGGTADDAQGHLPTDASPLQIDAALRAVAAGLNVRPREKRRFSAIDESDSPSPLSPRELEVLIALADGLSNKAIARRFEISQHTVKFHIESIFRKLAVATRAEAVAKGLRGGLVHM